MQSVIPFSLLTSVKMRSIVFPDVCVTNLTCYLRPNAVFLSKKLAVSSSLGLLTYRL